MGGTDAVAVGDGGEPLNVTTQQLAERLRLGFTQLRELRCDVGDRAVVLAHLHSCPGLVGRSRVAVGRQRFGEHERPLLLGDLGQQSPVAAFEAGGPTVGEVGDGRVTARVAQISQRGDGEIVIGVRERLTPGVGQGEQLRGPTATPHPAPHLGLGHLPDPTRGDQGVEMASNRGRRQPEARAERHRALRTVLVQRPGHPVARARVVRSSALRALRTRGSRLNGFHNAHVTYLPGRYTFGWPSTGRYLASYDRTAMAAPTTDPITTPRRPAWDGERWRPGPVPLRRLTALALGANIAVVATGGLVRLTGSGLGCPSWPDCTGSSLVPTRQLSWHKYVEFGNRLFTYVVLVAALGALVGVLRARPARPELRRWAWLVFLGVPAQAVMGGITVLTKLNPWAVAAHFVLSMLLIAAATVLWWRAGDRPGRPVEPTGNPLLRRLAVAAWFVTYAVFCAGTVVTGAGPHAGDPKAPRIAIKPASIAQLHADLVMLLVGLAVALAVAVTAMDTGPRARGTTRLLVGVLAAQAAVGWTQYFTKVPVGLVEIHLIGAACLAAVATGVVLAVGRTG